MNNKQQEVYIGKSTYKSIKGDVEGSYVNFLGEVYYCIKNYDKMSPFFMSIVSSSDHWLFISSTGGLSAGRANANSALFPYYTDDKITENSENTGSKTILLIRQSQGTYLWEPFSTRYTGLYSLERNLYKNVYGNKLVFEEINLDLGVTYRYGWFTSEANGFIKTSWLINDATESFGISLLDGLQNLLPYGANTFLQTPLSNLLDAYKRNELELLAGVGVFSLSAALTDVAEAAESLKATTVYQIGLESPKYLLSSKQLGNFRKGLNIQQENDIRGKRGAYFINSEFELLPNQETSWRLVAELNQDIVKINTTINSLKMDGDDQLSNKKIAESIEESTKELKDIIASADGLQITQNQLSTSHHFANVLFNSMRGGIFVDNYNIQKIDLQSFIKTRNRILLAENNKFFTKLPKEFSYIELIKEAFLFDSVDLQRLCLEYLPLAFGRRHGDPSRPWNRFSINLKNADGGRRLDYQGNWRDIFQNWEALAYSYPEFIEGMICKFLNATTADGYNPYKVTRDGIDWEKPELDNPLMNIGYWSDHQIIYLQKPMEVSVKFHPKVLTNLLNKKLFTYARVPYKIKRYKDLLEDWNNTIDFDWELDESIVADVSKVGTDARLLLDKSGNVFYVNLVEKLLTLLLAKLVNFIPEGGIWMNTQRPEWNDANNALVGKGISVVTTSYLLRYVCFLQKLFKGDDFKHAELTLEVKDFFNDVYKGLKRYEINLNSSFNDSERRNFMDELGQVGSHYRWNYYENSFTGEFNSVSKEDLLDFLSLSQHYIEHTLHANKREDNLYHSYNTLQLSESKAKVNYLYEMLEGQVAILSAGLLSSEDSLSLLKSLRSSKMYRADQNSYMLYPDRDLQGFLNKNIIPKEKVKDLRLVAKLIENENYQLISKGENDSYHFSGDLKNARDIKNLLDDLRQEATYTKLIDQEAEIIIQLFEDIFDHKSFTGRSGTFFAYEGLGSIYWHMVSKLLLAIQEVYLQALKNKEEDTVLNELLKSYYQVRQGIGFNKSPEIYGAFPTDPYSHTPAGQGAKQPGMTGQVKEEIITRMVELGLLINEGRLEFNFNLIQDEEWLKEATTFNYVDINHKEQSINLPVGSLAYTFCQVPIVGLRSDKDQIVINYNDNTSLEIAGNNLDLDHSKHIFQRDGVIKQLTILGKIPDELG